jgi:hypothetical protein
VWLNPFWAERRVLYTRLSPEACADRLDRLVTSLWSPSTWFRPLLGWVSADTFGLRRSGSRSAGEVTGRLVRTDEGTRVDAWLGLPRSAAIVSVIIAVGVAIPTAFLALAVTAQMGSDLGGALLVTASDVAVVLALLLAWPLSIHRSGAEATLEFLRKALDAHERPPPPRPLGEPRRRRN